MNLRTLQYVIALAELKSFNKAAARCHVSQPTLSAQLKKMEDSLGVILFERTNRNVRLTEIGRHVVTIARRISSDCERIKELAQSSSNPLGGTVRFGAIPTLASYFFPAFIAHIRSAIPHARLILKEDKTDALMNELTEGELDYVFAALPNDNPALSHQKLFDDPFLLAVPNTHELAQQKKITTNTLRKYALLLLEDGHCLGEQVRSLCSKRHMRIDDDFRATSLETLRQMVAAGTGITLLPAIAAATPHPALQYIPFSDTTPHRTIAVFWRKTLPTLRRHEMLLKQLTSLQLSHTV